MAVGNIRQRLLTSVAITKGNPMLEAREHQPPHHHPSLATKTREEVFRPLLALLKDPTVSIISQLAFYYITQ